MTPLQRFLLVSALIGFLAGVLFGPNLFLGLTGDASNVASSSDRVEFLTPEEDTLLSNGDTQFNADHSTHPMSQGGQRFTLQTENRLIIVDSTEVEENLKTRINDYRSEQNLPPLESHPTLNSTARAKSYHMYENEYFGHDEPGGREWYSFLDDVGSCPGVAGENLAYTGLGSNAYSETGVDPNEYIAERIFTLWKNSDEGHREHMLTRNGDELGVGVYIWSDPTHSGTTHLSVHGAMHSC